MGPGDALALVGASAVRAAAGMLRPAVLALTLAPLAIIALALGALGYAGWDATVGGLADWLGSLGPLRGLGEWFGDRGWHWMRHAVAAVAVLAVAVPAVGVAALLAASLAMTPLLTAGVARRRFPSLEKRRGGSFWDSLRWSLRSTAAALLVLAVSLPLWLVPPLMLVIAPLVWGWLTCRVMAFDALAEHASALERAAILRRHRWPLLAIGTACGLLGALPALTWVSALWFVVGFAVLAPLAVWLYAAVLAFSALWFAEYALAVLQRMRLADTPSAHGGATMRE
ncbi:MAG: EI24 domain-containing protein [Xylophilus ampelinus]